MESMATGSARDSAAPVARGQTAWGLDTQALEAFQ